MVSRRESPASSAGFARTPNPPPDLFSGNSAQTQTEVHASSWL